MVPPIHATLYQTFCIPAPFRLLRISA